MAWSSGFGRSLRTGWTRRWTSGDQALLASVELVKDRTRIRSFVSDKTEELGIPALGPSRSTTRLVELVELYETGKLDIHIREAFPLDRAADAHRSIQRGHGRGKIVLTVDTTRRRLQRLWPGSR